MMRFLVRPRNLYVLLSYGLLSCTPFVPWLFGQPVVRPGQLLGIELVCWIGAWAFCRRPARFHWLLLPAFLALPMELYLYAFYGQGISTHHLGIVFETSPAEAMEFLGSKVWLFAGVIAGVLAWFVTSWIAVWRTRDLDWDDVSRIVVLAVLALGAAVFGYGETFGIAPPPLPRVAAAAPGTAAPVKTGGAASPSATSAEMTAPPPPGSVPPAPKLPPLVYWARLPLDLDVFAQSWPFGLMARGIDFYKERVYLADLNRRSASFHFGAHAQQPAAEPQVVVMVIGESSRYDRWSLNGYARETNPLLSQETNMVVLPDVITSVSATRLSVPVIISRKPATQSLKDGFSEKSFLTAYKEAGFKTWWLSNQISFGQYDTPV
jgi:glucan phosphoethanolaminetransferase (alkaline phosphatase superfamily)